MAAVPFRLKKSIPLAELAKASLSFGLSCEMAPSTYHTIFLKDKKKGKKQAQSFPQHLNPPPKLCLG